MSSDEKYQDLREQMEEAARVVAQWPSWMIDRAQRQQQWDQRNDSEEPTSTASLPQPTQTR
jgi:hypothetical protein